ncbi:MAG: hypothetical protein ABF377_04260 [Akkermansiaceae bacterium]
MRKILTIIIALAASGLALPTIAEAGTLRVGYSTTYTSGHHACGCAIQTKRVFAGYDCNRHPVYRYYSVPTVHHCSQHGTVHRQSHYQQQRRPYVQSRHQQRSHYSERGRYQQRSSYRSRYRTPTCR